MVNIKALIDATDEASPLLLYDFTYPNFCCPVDFARNTTRSALTNRFGETGFSEVFKFILMLFENIALCFDAVGL